MCTSVTEGLSCAGEAMLPSSSAAMWSEKGQEGPECAPRGWVSEQEQLLLALSTFFPSNPLQTLFLQLGTSTQHLHFLPDILSSAGEPATLFGRAISESSFTRVALEVGEGKAGKGDCSLVVNL